MNECAERLLRVRDWSANHENNRSRELKRMLWVSVPNDLSADSYVELVSHEDGAAHLGVWIALLMVASRAKPRGSLVWGNGQPHTPESLARLTRLPQSVVSTAIERLLAIGLLESGEGKSRKKNRLTPHPGAGNPQDAARKPHEGAVEGKGMEHHHQEGKRTEKKRIRTEPKGTERARDERTIGRSGAPPAAADFSQKRDDADENPGVGYASPEDELKAIYRAKTREPITTELLHAIRVNLELSGVSVGDFVVEVRKHTQNKWRNPAGFLRDLSKRFRSKTRAAADPVTAAEAEAKNYRCPICGSTVRGQGGVPDGNGSFVPCNCASPDWIAQQRARGIFAPEEPPR
jgi:hypothetical protein